MAFFSERNPIFRKTTSFDRHQGLKEEASATIRKRIDSVSVNTVSSNINVSADKASPKEQTVSMHMEVKTDDPLYGNSVVARKGPLHVDMRKGDLSITTPQERVHEFHEYGGYHTYEGDLTFPFPVKTNGDPSVLRSRPGEIVILPTGERVEGGGTFVNTYYADQMKNHVDEVSPSKPASERDVEVSLAGNKQRVYDLTSIHGDVELAYFEGDSRISSKSGDVDVQYGKTDRLHIKTDSGNISVKGVNPAFVEGSGEIVAETEKGNISMESVQGKIKANTVNGAVHIDNAAIQERDSEVRTLVGDINVKVANKDLWVHAQTAHQLEFPQDFRVVQDSVLNDGDENGPGIQYRNVEGYFGDPQDKSEKLTLRSGIGNIVFDRTTQRDD